MACIVDNRRLYCTTADVWFGPAFASDDEAEDFLVWHWREFNMDPRECSVEKLEQRYEQYKDTPHD